MRYLRAGTAVCTSAQIASPVATRNAVVFKVSLVVMPSSTLYAIAKTSTVQIVMFFRFPLYLSSRGVV